LRNERRKGDQLKIPRAGLEPAQRQAPRDFKREIPIITNNQQHPTTIISKTYLL